MLLQPQAAHQVVAFLGVGRVFILGAGDPALGVRALVDDAAHGADEGLDVLDRHHPPDQAQHRRHLGRALRAQGGKAFERDAVGDVARALGGGAILHLAQAIGFVQRQDGVGVGVAVAPEPLEELDPHLAKVRQLARVALEDVAVVADPLALEEVDLALFGVNAVLRQNQGHAARLRQQAAEKAGVAGAGAVHRTHRQQIVRHACEQPQRLEHDAHGPEEIDERRVGAVLAVDLAQDVPGAPAVEKIAQLQVATGHEFEHHLLEQRQCPWALRALAQGLQQALDQGGGLGVAGACRRLLVQAVRRLVQEMLLEVHHVRRQRVLEVTVVAAAATQKDDGKAVLGVGADDLVEPAGDAAADVGERAFEQQGNVGARRLRVGLGHGCFQ